VFGYNVSSFNAASDAISEKQTPHSTVARESISDKTHHSLYVIQTHITISNKIKTC